MEYNTLATQEDINKTMEALRTINVEPFFVETKQQALEKIKELIPQGASVMNGSSVTLEQIGFIDYLKSETHGWNNLHKTIVEEKDETKKKELRRQAILSEYYLGSVHALSQTGEFVIASNTGSQLPHVVFTSPNLIFVVGAQKIVPTLPDALTRLREYVVPLEEKHMMDLYKVHTFPSKIVLFNRERPDSGRKVKMILVNEILGF